eukprot:7262790-Prymnesium_polylepis.2
MRIDSDVRMRPRRGTLSCGRQLVSWPGHSGQGPNFPNRADVSTLVLLRAEFRIRLMCYELCPGSGPVDLRYAYGPRRPPEVSGKV